MSRIAYMSQIALIHYKNISTFISSAIAMLDWFVIILFHSSELKKLESAYLNNSSNHFDAPTLTYQKLWILLVPKVFSSFLKKYQQFFLYG